MKNQWFISIKKNEGDLDLTNLKHNYPPKGYYWADPFLYQKDGKDYIFYELYDYKKGVIAYSEINDDMSFTDPTVILDLGYHMSYPFLIEDNGELYMIPENGAKWESLQNPQTSKTDPKTGHYIIEEENCGIDIFKCVSFPDKWEFEKTLFKGVVAGDSNILKFNNKYLLFTTLSPDMGKNYIVFSSDSLLGEYNPIIKSLTPHSRSAGVIYLDEESQKIMRFTQNSGGGYGININLKSIKIDFENKKWEEDLIHRINPDWHPDIFGTHHLDFNDKYIVVDGKRKIND